MAKTHYLVLDSFRGICACLVALSHFNANSVLSNLPCFDRGEIYVDFFFVLSGFVIFANYGEKLRSGYSIGKFTLLRLGRLYPLHFCVLAAFVGIDLLQMLLPFGGMAVYKPFSAPGEGIWDILANLFLIHSLHVSTYLAFNGPSWSISVEFYTYILFALILAYTGKYYRRVIVFTAATSAILLYNLSGELYAKLDYGVFRCIFGFACGALTYEVFSDVREKIAPLTKIPRLFAAAEAAAFISALIYITFFSSGLLSMMAPVVFGAVILVFAFEAGLISNILKLKPFLLLGTLSYSIYMNHMFISGKFFALPARILENNFGVHVADTVNNSPVFGTDVVTGTLWEIFYLLVVVAISYLSYRLIEDPCRNWTRKFVQGETYFKGFGFLKIKNQGS